MTAPYGEEGSLSASFKTDALFYSLKKQNKIAIAVSGGSDSLALLLMLVEWANKHGKQIHCLTVDHDLRAASRDEAIMVGQQCAALGISHDILKWHGQKPAAGLSNAARDARYELMAERCHALDIFDLVLGHQRDDQAETLMMRLARSDQGGRGLAGMPAQTEYRTETGRKISMHRPLLELSRADLQSFLAKRAINWVNDPTNDNHVYERVRTRTMLRDSEVLRGQLLAYAKVSARYRAASSLECADFINKHVDRVRYGGLSIDQAALCNLPKPVGGLVLQVLLSVVGGRDYLPAMTDVQKLLENVGGQTLARVRISLEDGCVYLSREVRNLPAVEKLGDKEILWDKRFSIRTSQSNAELVSGSNLDRDMVGDLVEKAQPPLSRIEKMALQSAPFLIFTQDGKVFVASCLEEVNSKLVSFSPRYGGFQRFCGAFDLPIRRALETLLTK